MFPSDRYLLETQAQFHGFDADDAIVEVAPREGERQIREEDVLDAIDANADELALVFFGGVNYFTGQLFNIPRLTEAAHSAGAVAGLTWLTPREMYCCHCMTGTSTLPPGVPTNTLTRAPATSARFCT